MFSDDTMCAKAPPHPGHTLDCMDEIRWGGGGSQILS